MLIIQCDVDRNANNWCFTYPGHICMQCYYPVTSIISRVYAGASLREGCHSQENRCCQLIIDWCQYKSSHFCLALICGCCWGQVRRTHQRYIGSKLVLMYFDISFCIHIAIGLPCEPIMRNCNWRLRNYTQQENQIADNLTKFPRDKTPILVVISSNKKNFCSWPELFTVMSLIGPYLVSLKK